MRKNHPFNYAKTDYASFHKTRIINIGKLKPSSWFGIQLDRLKGEP